MTDTAKHPVKEVRIVAINFDPEVAGIAPYVTALAREMSKSAQVEVVTTMPHYPEWIKRPAPRREQQASSRNSGFFVRRVWHYVPKKMSFIGRFVMEVTFAFSALAHRGRGPGILLVVSPSLVSSFALLIKSRLVCPDQTRILWIQDLYAAGLTQKYGLASPVTKLFVKIESQAIKLATRVAVIHPRFKAFAEESLHARPSSVQVIRNWSHVQAKPSPGSQKVREKYNLGGRSTLVCHAGNMGYKQGLENVIEAAKTAHLNAFDIEFVLIGDGNQRHELEKQALGLTNVHFLDLLPEQELMEVLAESDVLLICERTGMREMALPSKFTTYLTAQKPILLCSDKESVMAEELSLSGAGLRVDADAPGQLIQGVQQIVGDENLSETFIENGQRHLHMYLTPESAFAAFDELLTKTS